MTPRANTDTGIGPLEFFTGEPVKRLWDIMSTPTFITGVDPGEYEPGMTALSDAVQTSVIYCQDRPDGMSLVRFRMAAGCGLPSHSHSSDCLYVVVSGMIRMGNRELPAGSGFFVPAGRRYSYEAGPAGVEVLEFRGSTTFDMTVTENSRTRWRQIRDRALTASKYWEEPTAAGGASDA